MNSRLHCSARLVLATPREFQYPETNGKTYILWAAQDKGGAHVSIAEKTAPGVYKRIGDLGAASFTNAVMSDQKTAKQHISDLIVAAKALHDASKTKPQSPANPNPLPDLKLKQAAVDAAEHVVVADIKANACLVLNAGRHGHGFAWPCEHFRVH